MANKPDSLERYYAANRAEWRAWLEHNHASSSGVWLIYYKKESGKPRVAYDEAVEEALCFGWIDSKPNKLDDERYMQLFSPRKSGSAWSKLNKERVERLIAQGLMASAGMALVEASRQDGTWSALDDVEALTVPDDLTAALAANPTAMGFFDAFPPSSKKNILWWIESAKKPETRQKRIDETVSMAAQNLRANHFRQ